MTESVEVNDGQESIDLSVLFLNSLWRQSLFPLCWKQTLLGMGLSLLSLGLFLPEWANAQSEILETVAPVQYITRYDVSRPDSVEDSAVYGMFDIGQKPSVVITTHATDGGLISFQLHGKHYRTPALTRFYVQARFEDVTGRIFEESSWVAFDAVSSAPASPMWFQGLEEVSGLFGQQPIRFSVPYGTSAIHLVGRAHLEDKPAPFTLLGYISHIQAP